MLQQIYDVKTVYIYIYIIIIIIYDDKEDEMSNNYTKYNMERRRKLRELLVKQHGGRCLYCGSMRMLEFAHIKPTKLSGKGRGSYRRLKDIRDNPLCYELLCYSCHRQLDNFSDGSYESEYAVFGAIIIKWSYE